MAKSREEILKEIEEKEAQIQKVYTSVFASMRENTVSHMFCRNYIPGMFMLTMAKEQFDVTMQTYDYEKRSPLSKVVMIPVSVAAAVAAGAAGLVCDTVIVAKTAVAEVFKAVTHIPSIITRYFKNRRLRKEINAMKKSIGEKIETRKEIRARIKEEKKNEVKA